MKLLDLVIVEDSDLEAFLTEHFQLDESEILRIVKVTYLNRQTLILTTKESGVYFKPEENFYFNPKEEMYLTNLVVDIVEGLI